MFCEKVVNLRNGLPIQSERVLEYCVKNFVSKSPIFILKDTKYELKNGKIDLIGKETCTKNYFYQPLKNIFEMPNNIGDKAKSDVNNEKAAISIGRCHKPPF